MLGKTHSIAIVGVEATVVDIEANIGAGLPGVYIGGLADTTISESRDRMKTAIINSGLQWPKTKVIVNLSPANLPKSGSHFDLGILGAILLAQSNDSEFRQRLTGALLLGEVGLDGAIKPVRGVLPALKAAREKGIFTCIIPTGNAAEAALLKDQRILLVNNLLELTHWANGEAELECVDARHEAQQPERESLDMRDVAGQREARYAAEIAAAGGHHLMMVGPPGTGKSMIAARLPGLLPPLDLEASLQATAVHSVAGKTFHGPVLEAPFVAPHHSVTRAGLLGGGSGHPLPGAVSLAHHGVLFLDEVSEIQASVLDSLRTPLESGVVRMVRRYRDIEFPAQFQLVLAANPCKCAAEDPTDCKCSVSARQRYLNNLSGPLRDRIDLFVRTHSKGAVLSEVDTESTETIAERVAFARERSIWRWQSAGLTATCNARMNPHRLRREFPADDAAMAYLSALLADGSVSQRGIDRTLKVAWTIADLTGIAIPNLDHVARAVDLHEQHAAEGVLL